MQKTVSFVLDEKICTIDFNGTYTPTTTVLQYLRSSPLHKGLKEGCAEGDCGACTVVIGELENNRLTYKAWDSCLVFLPMLQGKQLITIENLTNKGNSHPVQKAMVECNGSQCGYCTPGIVMSLFALYKKESVTSRESIDDALTGNLCRCTGYKPIIEAAAKACAAKSDDSFTVNEKKIIELLVQIRREGGSLEIQTDKQYYYRPQTLAEALTLRNKLPDSILVNGGTDVALRVTKRHELLKEVIDLSGIEELKGFSMKGTEVAFGAGMSLEDVKKEAQTVLPALYDALTVFGSKQIRSVATLGGNLGSASPIGDTLPVLMAYNAEIILQSLNGNRKVNMNNFVLGYRKTERRQDEVIAAIVISTPAPDAHIKFYKVSKRKDLDISTVSAGFSLQLNKGKIDSITLAYGGMAAVTKRALKAEEYLKNKVWNRENVENAMMLVGEEFTPISDARSGAEFRTAAAKNLLLKFWSETL